MNKKYIIIGIIVLVFIVVGVILIVMTKKKADQASQLGTTTQTNNTSTGLSNFLSDKGAGGNLAPLLKLFL